MRKFYLYFDEKALGENPSERFGAFTYIIYIM